MKVQDILRIKGNRVATASPQTSLHVIIGRMSVEHIGAIVISEDGQTVAGILSERDKLREVVARMTRTRVRHVPVIERGRLCGIVSIGDAVKNRLEEVELESDVLRDVYRGTH